MTLEELEYLIKKYDTEQRPEEYFWFYQHAQIIEPKTIIEIGVRTGGNLKLLSTLLPQDGLLIGMDHKQPVLLWDILDAPCKTQLVLGNSHSASTKEKLIETLEGRVADILFIDGDHSTEGMLMDFKDYSPLVRTGGIIAVHDIFYLNEVAEAWEQLPGNDWYESPRNRSSLGIGFIKKG